MDTLIERLEGWQDYEPMKAFCAEAIPDINAAISEIRRLSDVVKRLGSMEALTHTHAISATITGDELRARIEYARTAMCPTHGQISRASSASD